MDVLGTSVPLIYQSHLQFLKTLRGTEYVKLINFQDPIHKSYFHIYHTLITFNVPQKLVNYQYICGRLSNISFLSDISYPFPFRKTLRTTAQLELINFQDTMKKSDFNTFYASSFFHLPEKLAAVGIWMVLEHQFPLRSQLLQLFLKNLRGTAYVQLTNPKHKSDVDIYKMIQNVPQKLAKNQYIC